jgi:transposase
VAFRIIAGQVNDCTQAALLLEGQQAEAVLADRGYDTNTILAQIQAAGAEAVIPSCRHRCVQREHNRKLYAERNRIERCFSRLKQMRRFSTRYCKTNRRLPFLHRPRMRLDQTSAI